MGNEAQERNEDSYRHIGKHIPTIWGKLNQA